MEQEGLAEKALKSSEVSQLAKRHVFLPTVLRRFL
jgi:hypothetical protein